MDINALVLQNYGRLLRYHASVFLLQYVPHCRITVHDKTLYKRLCFWKSHTGLCMHSFRYILELVFSIPRDRPRIILLLRCSVAGSPVRNPGSLSLVGNDPQKKPFICLSPACTSQQSQLSCNNLSFNCTLKSNSSAALLYINPKNALHNSLSW